MGPATLEDVFGNATLLVTLCLTACAVLLLTGLALTVRTGERAHRRRG